MFPVESIENASGLAAHNVRAGVHRPDLRFGGEGNDVESKEKKERKGNVIHVQIGDWPTCSKS